jgi:DNA-binding NarL/FixJ family response regulator
MKTLRAMIIDDNALAKNRLANLFAASDIEIVGETNDSFEAVEIACRLRPDIVLMNAVTASAGSIQALYPIQAEMPQIRIVIVTALDHHKNLLETIRESIQRKVDPLPAGRLTKKELEVLGLVGTGATNKEISVSLYISENTVKYHVRNIMNKLQVRNRARLAAYATRRGIVPARVQV